jgi:hypothetical protein
MSINPGTMVVPRASSTRSTPAVLHWPTHVMRPPRVTSVPRSMAFRFSIVRMRALASAMEPDGSFLGTVSLIVALSDFFVVMSYV